MGLKYDAIFSIRERTISHRGWQNAFAWCPYVRHLFLSPSIQGASYIQFPFSSPQDSFFTDSHSSFLNPFLLSSIQS